MMECRRSSSLNGPIENIGQRSDHIKGNDLLGVGGQSLINKSRSRFPIESLIFHHFPAPTRPGNKPKEQKKKPKLTRLIHRPNNSAQTSFTIPPVPKLHQL